MVHARHHPQHELQVRHQWLDLHLRPVLAPQQTLGASVGPPLLDDIAHRRPKPVVHDRVRAEPQSPAGLLDSPAEIDVVRARDELLVAAANLEVDIAPDREVGTDRVRQVAVRDVQAVPGGAAVAPEDGVRIAQLGDVEGPTHVVESLQVAPQDGQPIGIDRVVAVTEGDRGPDGGADTDVACVGKAGSLMGGDHPDVRQLRAPGLDDVEGAVSAPVVDDDELPAVKRLATERFQLLADGGRGVANTQHDTDAVFITRCRSHANSYPGTVPAVTVVIPTRNRRALLTRAVATVRAQTLADWQLVLVDDASTDDTWDWISSQDDPRIVGHRVAQQGERSAARNTGLARADAPYVLFLDDDDELRPDALAALSAGLDETEAASVAVGSVYFVDPSGRTTPPMATRRLVHNPWRELLAGWVAITGQMLIRTDVLRAIGGFRPDMPMAEDQELWFRLVEQERPAIFLPVVVLDHRPHRSPDKVAHGTEVEREIRSAYLERTGHRRAVARAIAAQERLRASNRASQDGDFRRAAGLYFSGIARCPELLLSPVIGARMRRTAPVAVGQAILPKKTVLALRRAVRAARSRRAPAKD